MPRAGGGGEGRGDRGRRGGGTEEGGRRKEGSGPGGDDGGLGGRGGEVGGDEADGDLPHLAVRTGPVGGGRGPFSEPGAGGTILGMKGFDHPNGAPVPFIP